jgi:hypothetical protein
MEESYQIPQGESIPEKCPGKILTTTQGKRVEGVGCRGLQTLFCSLVLESRFPFFLDSCFLPLVPDLFLFFERFNLTP